MKSVRAKSADPLRLPLCRGPGEPLRGRAWLERAEWIAAALAVVVAIVPLPFAARVVGAVLVGAALAVALRARRPHPPAGWIVADAAGLARERAGSSVALARWGAQFGVTVLASESRDRGLLAFTTAEATRFVPVRASDDDDATAARDLFARASTVGDADLASVPPVPGADAALSACDARSLLGAIRAREPDAEGRIVSSDPRGAPIVLDATELRAGDRVIDLASPLEWRAFLFLESAGPLAAVVQATWVRQAGIEVVLVAPMPVEPSARDVSPRRDPRLNPSAPDAPPPLELRMAVERLFMAPLRQALDRAPRVSRVPPPPTSVRTRGDVDKRA